MLLALVSIVNVMAAARTVEYTSSLIMEISRLNKPPDAPALKLILDTINPTTDNFKSYLVGGYMKLKQLEGVTYADTTALLAAVDAECSTYGLTSAYYIPGCKARALFMFGFETEALAYCEANKNNSSVRGAMWGQFYTKKEYLAGYEYFLSCKDYYRAFDMARRIPDAQKAFDSADKAMNGYCLSASKLSIVITTLGNLNYSETNITNAMRLALYKKINIKYSMKVAQDESTWLPIISGVRLMIEALEQ